MRSGGQKTDAHVFLYPQTYCEGEGGHLARHFSQARRPRSLADAFFALLLACFPDENPLNVRD